MHRERVLKLCGAAVAVAILCVVARSVDGAPSSQHESSSSAAVTATVEELPQRTMTLQNGYHPGLFPFNKGEPFVVDPNLSAIDFNTKPPNGQLRTDEYYDYDSSKLEEVPYDYKGDPIDRKDVVEPNAPRPNDIKPNGGSKTKQTADIYQFLNLPVKYSSSDKFPLMSSSYANTKIQGSGPSSSSLSNHKMPATSAPAAPTTSWYNAPKTSSSSTTTTTTTSTTTARPTPTTTTTTTTTTPSPSQEYEEESAYDYDYYHQQEPASTSTTTTSTTTTAAPTTVHHHQNPSTTTVTYRPTASTITTTASRVSFVDSEATHNNNNDQKNASSAVTNKTSTTSTTTTVRPEIDSKLDGPSFADYDAIKPSNGGEPAHRPPSQQQQFKPMPSGNYPFADDKTYPLITSGKVPMTFTAHVSSGISLNSNSNQKDHYPQQQQQHHHVSDQVVKPVGPSTEQQGYAHNGRPSQQLEVQDSDGGGGGGHRTDTIVVVQDATRTPTTSASRPPLDAATNRHPTTSYTKVKPQPRPGEKDQPDAAVYYKVRPTAGGQPPIQGRPPYPSQPQQTEPLAVKTSHAGPSDAARKPANGEQPPPAVRPQQQPYPQVVLPPPSSDVHVKNKPPQYAAPQPSQPDTSKFKPPKHVINHFIKTQPNEDNKSYALQTSFSIGMDGERTDARPQQGVGQVLMVEEHGGSAAAAVEPTAVVDHTIMPAVLRPKATTSIPFIQQPPPPPPQQRPVQKPSQYPRPQWENKPPAGYYPPPKRDGAPPPPPPPQQRPNLPNILPQFRPNAKVDAPQQPMVTAQSHSAATIERVQIPMDHLRPPPLPKPQFLKVDRNDDIVVEELLAGGGVPLPPGKETRILQPDRRLPPPKVTTLQMIQHGAPAKTRDDSNKDNPVHVIYAANAPPQHRPSAAAEKTVPDDSVILDVKDRSDERPILKTKTAAAVNKPLKTDFPYQIVKPDDNQNASLMEYKAYSPTKPDTVRPNDQELVPNLQDYVPVATRESAASNVVMPHKPITATLKTSEDNHKVVVVPEEGGGGHKPQLQNFQIPFQPSLKLPENSNGWSVVRKSPTVDSVSERIDETGGDAVASTEKFDPDNFKPQLVGGFMPINPLAEEAKEKAVEQSERAK